MKKTAIIVVLIFAVLVLVAAKYDYLLEMGEKTVKSSECRECHKMVYDEWSMNFHAKAYTNDPFKKASKDYQTQECITCHAAQQIAEEQALKTRPVHKEEGVSCTTCHLRDNMIYGPYKLIAKHNSEQDESMLKSEFCAECHRSTYNQWQSSGEKKTCQECHMPRVEGKLVQGFPLSLLVPKRMMGQHVQIYEGLLKEVALITGETRKDFLKVSLTNRGGGHTMPTGKYGDYRIILKTLVKDMNGKEILSKEEVLSNLKGSGVPSQKTAIFEYPISFENGKHYEVRSSLIYNVVGRSERLMATWGSDIVGTQ